MDVVPDLVHATAIALDAERGALLVGPSGAGKSDLALRCLACTAIVSGRAVSPMLVSDDQVVLTRSGDVIQAAPPASIAGALEVRGLGILSFPHLALARVRLVVDLTPDAPIARLPDPVATIARLGVELPLLRLAAFEASAPLKVLLALDAGLPP